MHARKTGFVYLIKFPTFLNKCAKFVSESKYYGEILPWHKSVDPLASMVQSQAGTGV